MPDGFAAPGPLTLGLLNNMTGAQGESTERQFRHVLNATGHPLRIVSATDPAALDLPGLDALIVTGVQPRAAALREEPCWPMLTALADAVLEERVPTLWSCLAAQAAILHRHGIERRKLPGKLVAIATCERNRVGHPLLADLPERWLTPHSRYNELSIAELEARACRIISRSDRAGADIIIDEAPVLQIYLQGHPEYGPETLLREHRRDVAEYLAGTRELYPPLPENYLPAEAVTLIHRFRQNALATRDPALIDDFPDRECAAAAQAPWADASTRFFANWLDHIRATRALANSVAPG